MIKRITGFLVVSAVCLTSSGEAEGRGFGGFSGYRSSSFSSYGGDRSFSSSYSGYRSSSLGGYDRSFESSGYRSADSYSGWRGGAGVSSSYDRSFTDSRGGSINVEGQRGAAVGPYGGAAVGGSREVTATGADGRSYSGYRSGGAAVGPYGRTVGGSEHVGTASGPRGTVSGGWESAFAGTRFPTDLGLSRYSSLGVGGVAHSTSYWSGSYLSSRAGLVRSSFGNYSCFTPTWYTAHPGCWTAAGWAARTAWVPTTWLGLSTFCQLVETPTDYDYGSSVVYQDNNVYVDGVDSGTAEQYATQATTIADKGQQANPPPEQEWKPLGVFALVQGDDKNSNNVFQLAVNKDGIIRGNYFDGLLDATSPVYGSVDRNTQRAAWTIGKKNDRVFETGVYNLTKPETSVLVHFGTQKTQQWMLVRVEQNNGAK